MKTAITFGLLALLFVLGTGCAKVPQQAVDSAQLALQDARLQEADVFAPELFNAAQDSFNAAQAEIELQGGKFALMRSYDSAQNLLASASDLSRQASEEGAVRKQEMRAETENLLLQAREAAAQAKMLLTKAPRGKEGRIALVSIGSDVNSLDSLFVEVEDLLAQGNVKLANERALVAMDRATSLTGELQEAINKTKGRG